MIYWVVFSSIIILSLNQYFKNHKKISVLIFYCVGFFLIFFVGFRYESVDYYGYFNIWKKVNFELFGFPFFKAPGGTTGNEFVFATAISFFKSIGFSFEGFIF
jgi:hypothetical protein